MFAAGFTGALWLVALALVVARFYGTWRRCDGWAEIGRDVGRLSRSGSSIRANGEHYGIGALLGYSVAWVGFLYALSR